MAVSIDTVYQKVLAIANKEQRGYVTPLEFNLLANQAQFEMFEQYFYDLDQYLRRPGNDTRHADTVTMLEEKISLFEVFKTSLGGYNGATNCYDLPSALHKLSTVSYVQSSGIEGIFNECEYVTKKNLKLLLSGNLTLPSTTRPIYVRQGSKINVYIDKSTSPYFTELQTNSLIEIDYIKQPIKVEWAYAIVNEQALYNSTNSTDFELHPSEESKLVIKILELAGIVIKDPQLYQQAATEETETLQQEKS